jgi:FMN phosphatase YigB (HAD superfamily)
LKQTKREPSTFRKVLEAIGRRPDECLLVDDSALNLSAAASIGLSGIRFTSAAAFARDLSARGLLGQDSQPRPRTPTRRQE